MLDLRWVDVPAQRCAPEIMIQVKLEELKLELLGLRT